MAFVDTKERIFVNGQIYSRPIGGGPVHGPDNRRFTPDPNPYGVPPETPRYGQGTVDTLLYRPGVDKFEIENPVLRPGDTYEVLPLFSPSPMPEPRGYGQGSVGFADTTPSPYYRQHDYDPLTPEDHERIRIMEGRKPIPLEGLDPFSPNPFRNMPLDFLDQYLNNRGIIEQNQEVMGLKEQTYKSSKII